jgi:excisionase family DNA binding protein
MLISVSLAARELGLSVDHLRRMIRAGKIPTYQLGPKATRVDVEEIKALHKLIKEVDSNSDDEGANRE